MATINYGKDVDRSALAGQAIAVLGLSVWIQRLAVRGERNARGDVIRCVSDQFIEVAACLARVTRDL